ncbi:uncharacterized protein LOC117199485 isoform X2 [Orcinus orca]|uniref:uncharacterized protein LOC117199485 isoform X2 n=1 Tax=Orcinus orca TaxID=9733 RepID=UPI0021120786|nr:uncharacterized protein LOC117199485 isoform X2 [Orcinus orca]
MLRAGGSRERVVRRRPAARGVKTNKGLIAHQSPPERKQRLPAAPAPRPSPSSGRQRTRCGACGQAGTGSAVGLLETGRASTPTFAAAVQDRIQPQPAGSTPPQARASLPIGREKSRPGFQLAARAVRQKPPTARPRPSPCTFRPLSWFASPDRSMPALCGSGAVATRRPLALLGQLEMLLSGTSALGLELPLCLTSSKK